MRTSTSVASALDGRRALLAGVAATTAETGALRQKLSRDLLPSWYVSLLEEFPMIGTCFSLDERYDESGLGVDLRWLHPDDVILEALEMQPGRAVVPLGYLPVAECLQGSGDPYFLNMADGSRDPSLVRVPHDHAADREYPEEAIEVVSHRLSEFFQRAIIE